MDSDVDDSSAYNGKHEYSEARAPILPASERDVGESKYPVMVLRFLDSARRNGRYTDMVMRSAVGEFHVHKIVMAAVSKTIAAENLRNPTYSVATHNGPNVKTSHTALAAIVEFAYSGKTRLNVENVEGVLSLAIHFQIQFLINACQDFIVEHMSENTIIKFLEFSAGYPLDIIKDRVFRYLIDNIKYLMTEKEGKLLHVSALALIEFLNHDNTGHHRQGNESKLELAIRYIHANEIMDKEDESDLVESVKSLISGMSDNGLGKCLTKMPQLLFKDRVRKFLLHTGICLKNMTSPTSPIDEKPNMDKGPVHPLRHKKSNHKDDTYNKHPKRSHKVVSAESSDSVNYPANDSFCADLKHYQKRTHSNSRTSYHRYNQSHNKSPTTYSNSNHFNICKVSISDEELDSFSNVHYNSTNNKSSRSNHVIGTRDYSRSKSFSGRCETSSHEPGETSSHAAKSSQTLDYNWNKKTSSNKSRCFTPGKSHRESNVSPRIVENDNQPWADSPRFANDEYEMYPDLEPLPDPRTKLGEIALFYHVLPDNRPALGGLRLTYFHRRPKVTFFRFKDVGVVPPSPRRYDVIKLKDNQWISGVGLGVSDVIHWISFYTSDKRMFGPFGHDGGHSVRVEAPTRKPELYSIHCTTRSWCKTDVLANALFRWVRPP